VSGEIFIVMDDPELRVSPCKTFFCQNTLKKGMALSSIINAIKKSVKFGGGGGGRYDPYYDQSQQPPVEYADNEPSEEEPDVQDDDD